MSLEEALAGRRSLREFTDRELTWEEISQLLWAAQGITAPGGLHTAPSAGALYPLEIYVALPDGACHYLPQGHAVESVSKSDLRQDLWQAGLRQDALRQASATSTPQPKPIGELQWAGNPPYLTDTHLCAIFPETVGH